MARTIRPLLLSNWRRVAHFVLVFRPPTFVRSKRINSSKLTRWSGGIFNAACASLSPHWSNVSASLFTLPSAFYALPESSGGIPSELLQQLRELVPVSASCALPANAPPRL